MDIKAYNGNEPYLFVSYCHKDSDRVLPHIAALQRRGFRVWDDEGIEVGTEWPNTIADHILDSQCVLAFVSQHSEASLNCRQEITFALSKRKELLTVYLEEFAMTPGLEMLLGLGQAIYYERQASDSAFWEELCASPLLPLCREVTLNRAQLPELYASAKELLRLKQPRQDEAAAALLLHAAQQGHAGAQNLLGRMYKNGRGVPQSDEEAVAWISEAAQQGLDKAQYNLGLLYENGTAAPQIMNPPSNGTPKPRSRDT